VLYAFAIESHGNALPSNAAVVYAGFAAYCAEKLAVTVSPPMVCVEEVPATVSTAIEVDKKLDPEAK